jgi:cytochrome c oxidase subunit 3
MAMNSHATHLKRTAIRALQHHFENMEQQREAGTLGMWVFLVTEIMFFGGMFLAYTLYRRSIRPLSRQPVTTSTSRSERSTRRADSSSFTMAMAVYFTQVGNDAADSLFVADADSRSDVSWRKAVSITTSMKII